MPKKFTKSGGKILLEDTRRTKASTRDEEEKYLAYLREREAKKPIDQPAPLIAEEKVEPKADTLVETPVVSDPMERYKSALRDIPKGVH